MEERARFGGSFFLLPGTGGYGLGILKNQRFLDSLFSSMDRNETPCDVG
jgi:hypothetical protein